MSGLHGMETALNRGHDRVFDLCADGFACYTTRQKSTVCVLSVCSYHVVAIEAERRWHHEGAGGSEERIKEGTWDG